MTEQEIIVSDRKVLAIVDGNSILCRAFFALPYMKSPSGKPVNAVYGFMSIIASFIERFSPDALICAFDGGHPEYRVKLTNGGYKAKREQADDLLKQQFPLIGTLLGDLSIPAVRVKGWEGDDIIGTLSAAISDDASYNTLLLTSDKDMYQLIDESTFVVSPVHGMSEITIYGTEEVKNRYGLYPSAVPDYIGLKGDSSDNIRGVYGIGEKTASKLISEYGSLEHLYEHIDEIQGSIGKKLFAGQDDAFASREVATIRRNINLTESKTWNNLSNGFLGAGVENDASIIRSMTFPLFSKEQLHEAFAKFGFSSKLEKRFANACDLSNDSDIPSSDALDISQMYDSPLF